MGAKGLAPTIAFPRLVDEKQRLLAPPLQADIEEFLATRRSDRSREIYRRELTSFFADLAGQLVIRETIEAYRDGLLAGTVGAPSRRGRPRQSMGLKKSTVALRLSAARSFFDWALQSRRVPSNPVRGVGVPQEPGVEGLLPHLARGESPRPGAPSRRSGGRTYSRGTARPGALGLRVCDGAASPAVGGAHGGGDRGRRRRLGPRGGGASPLGVRAPGDLSPGPGGGWCGAASSLSATTKRAGPCAKRRWDRSWGDGA